jgi:hypothetical protein
LYLIFHPSLRRRVYHTIPYTDKNEKKIFLIYREIQSGAAAKSYLRNGFLIYEEMRKHFPIYEIMRRPLVIYDFATAPTALIYEENLIFFLSVYA